MPNKWNSDSKHERVEGPDYYEFSVGASDMMFGSSVSNKSKLSVIVLRVEGIELRSGIRTARAFVDRVNV